MHTADANVERPIGRARPERYPPSLAPPAVDPFGVPTRMLGHHDPDTWALIGRTVGLAALLEDRLVALLQMLRLKVQSEYAGTRVSTIVQELRGEAPSGNTDWDGWIDWLNRVSGSLNWRNGVVHNLWSPKSGQQLYGHRLAPNGKVTSDRIKIDQLRSQLLVLVGLVDEAQVWVAKAGSEADRRTRERTRERG